MKIPRPLLAAAMLCSTSLAGYSQTATGTYTDASLSLPQRLQLADKLVSSGTDETAIYRAAVFMLGARPVIHLLNAFPQFDAQVLADPTLSGTIATHSSASTLYWSAVQWKVTATPALADKVAFLGPLLSSTLFTPITEVMAQKAYAGLVCQQAQAQINASDYSDAIATLAPVVGWNGAQAVALTCQCKVALRAPDALAWAKLLYFCEDFGHTQAGIDAVCSALRGADTNLARANAFIQYQKDGQGRNLLDGVTAPQVTFTGNSPWAKALDAPDNLSALKIAAESFATAANGGPLNAATDLVAQWLRNTDCSLVRANAFVTATTRGQPFTIAELSGASGN